MCDLMGMVRRTLNAVQDVFVGRMPTFDVDSETINAFRIGDAYLFKHYFEEDDVFGELRQYYNSEAYRFEVPAAEFDAVRELLAEQFYELVVVEDPEPFCVVRQKYTKYPEYLFQNAVAQRSKGEYTVFLLTDQLTVEQAVNHGARPLADTDVDLAF